MSGQMELAWRPEGWVPDRYAGEPGWSVGRYGGNSPIRWWFAKEGNRYWEGYRIPLWFPVILLAVPTTILWYRGRKETRDAIRRLRSRLVPRQPRKMGFGLIVKGIIAHVLIALPGFIVIDRVFTFLLLPNAVPSGSVYDDPAYRFFNGIFSIVGLLLLLGAPVLGILWAWLYVRWQNRLFRTFKSHSCLTCGYDLTGNESGTCPECGKEAKGLNYAKCQED